MSYKTSRKKYRVGTIKIGVLLAIAIVTSACKINNLLHTSEIYTEGYVVDSSALEAIVIGSSRDQVLLTLGSPSMTSTIAMLGDEVFYYISQRRYRGAKFMKSKVIDRRVLTIYFNSKGQVKKIANYGLQDGKLFDFSSKTTAIEGREQPFLNQLIRGIKAVPATGLPTISR
ncbi:MAG: Outer membrane protein assembly factor BamE [Candidatus Tokpelaia sp. JSC188]|nr:MAG: Outer membrane protein assembly factor BamE [Candidatus Tokpelaia sp. JSC188]